ncbi:MAG: hypothetical protein AAB425_15995, partial [Bdellovibrionota bacterium]
YALDDDSTKLGATYVLEADLSLAGGPGTSLGTLAAPFLGSFDGSKRTLSNLTIDQTATDYQGLFGYAGAGSVLKNLILSSITVKGKLNVGGVAGYSEGTIQKVAVQGTSLVESIQNTGATNVGGIAGQLYKPGVIDQCKVGASVIVRDTQANGDRVGGVVGGLVGIGSGAGSFATVQNSYSLASVTSGAGVVGGIVGYMNYGKVLSTYF